MYADNKALLVHDTKIAKLFSIWRLTSDWSLDQVHLLTHDLRCSAAVSACFV